MKFSYNWLREYVDDLPKARELADLLTMQAYEVEEIKQVEDDILLAIDVLPNRSGDSLSHRGVAREIATLMKQELKKDSLRQEVPKWKPVRELSIDIKDSKLCDKYSGAVMESVKIGPSPDWLKEKLEVLGLNSINNVVDALNYIMIDMGQPLHAFDAGKLRKKNGWKITVRNAKKGEKITTLTGVEYELTEDVLLIVDGNTDRPVGIAGIKGGAGADVDESTTDIIIEAAHFDYASIHRSSKQLKLVTDASVRFQNAPSSRLVEHAIRDAVELIKDIAGGKLVGVTTEGIDRGENPDVSVTTRQVNILLGTEMSAADIERILDQLGFDCSRKGDNFVVRAPFERTDIKITEDVIEEIGRVYGYDKIKPKMHSLKISPDTHKTFYYTNKIRDVLVSEGFSEVMTYSFVDEGKVQLANPLAINKSYLRSDLHSELIKSLETNGKNSPLFGNETIKLFEIGNVFSETKETLELGIGVYVPNDVQEQQEILLRAQSVIADRVGQEIEGDLLTDTLLGDLGSFIEKLPKPKFYDDLEDIESNSIVFEMFSQYPFVLRDIAVWVPKAVESQEVHKVIKQEAGELLVQSTLFDEFEKDNKVSYAYRLVFQSYDRTLTDDEVNIIMARVTDAVESKGWEVR